MKKRSICFAIILSLLAILFIGATVAYADETGPDFKYENDPTENCAVMQDAKVDPNAVYGFSPRSDGGLKEYADFDWSDKALIEKSRNERIAYFEQYSTMYDKAEEMFEAGCDIEEIARTVSAMRNQIRLDSYKDNPEGLEALKKRNLEKYGNENGPTPEYLFNQYGSWEMVFQKAFSENAAMDACLGLYDERFEYYSLFDNFVEHTPVTDEGYPATYDKEGLTDGCHCSVCGMIIEEQKAIPKLEKEDDPEDVPKTGDCAPVVPMMLLAAVSMAGLALTLGKSKEK